MLHRTQSRYRRYLNRRYHLDRMMPFDDEWLVWRIYAENDWYPVAYSHGLEQWQTQAFKKWRRKHA